MRYKIRNTLKHITNMKYLKIENEVFYYDKENEITAKFMLIEEHPKFNYILKSNFASRLYSIAKRRNNRTNHKITVINTQSKNIIYCNNK